MGVSQEGGGNTWDTHPPPALTPSGGHQNTYGWQAGGTHPTGMLSCKDHCQISKVLCREQTLFLANRSQCTELYVKMSLFYRKVCTDNYIFLGVATGRRKVVILKAELKFIMIRKTTHWRGIVIYSCCNLCVCFLSVWVLNFILPFFTNRRRFEREKLGCLGVPEVWAMSPTMERLE